MLGMGDPGRFRVEAREPAPAPRDQGERGPAGATADVQDASVRARENEVRDLRLLGGGAPALLSDVLAVHLLPHPGGEAALEAGILRSVEAEAAVCARLGGPRHGRTLLLPLAAVNGHRIPPHVPPARTRAPRRALRRHRLSRPASLRRDPPGLAPDGDLRVRDRGDDHASRCPRPALVLLGLTAMVANGTPMREALGGFAEPVGMAGPRGHAHRPGAPRLGTRAAHRALLRPRVRAELARPGLRRC